MARSRPFRRFEIDAEICAKIATIMEVKRYRGSFTSFVESVLDRYADGLLVEAAESAARPVRAEFAGFEKKQPADEKRSKRSAA